jgi:hypothetical protein
MTMFPTSKGEVIVGGQKWREMKKRSPGQFGLSNQRNQKFRSISKAVVEAVVLQRENR